MGFPSWPEKKNKDSTSQQFSSTNCGPNTLKTFQWGWEIENRQGLHVKNSDIVQRRMKQHKVRGGHPHSDKERLLWGEAACFIGLHWGLNMSICRIVSTNSWWLRLFINAQFSVNSLSIIKISFYQVDCATKRNKENIKLAFPLLLTKSLTGGNFHFSYCFNAISYWFLLTRQYNQSLTYIMSSTYKTALWCRYHPYFTDKETQATKLNNQPKVSQLCN